jgi:hypothetical protein
MQRILSCATPTCNESCNQLEQDGQIGVCWPPCWQPTADNDLATDYSFFDFLTGPKVAYMSPGLFSRLIEKCESHKCLSQKEKWNWHFVQDADFGPIVQKSNALKTALPRHFRKFRFLDRG